MRKLNRIPLIYDYIFIKIKIGYLIDRLIIKIVIFMTLWGDLGIRQQDLREGSSLKIRLRVEITLCALYMANKIVSA